MAYLERLIAPYVSGGSNPPLPFRSNYQTREQRTLKLITGANQIPLWPVDGNNA
jgi:hypothetical protein